MSETHREMTLDEWCGRLPDCHLVNKELSRLKEENETLKQRLLDVSAELINREFEVKELEEERVWTCAQHKKDYPTRCPWCWVDELKAQLSEKEQEVERLKGEINTDDAWNALCELASDRADKIEQLQTKLSRYESGIEVGGLLL